MQGYPATTGVLLYILHTQYAPYTSRLSDTGIGLPDIDIDIMVTASDCFGLGTEMPRSGSVGLRCESRFQPGHTTKTKVALPGGYRLPPDSVIVPALYAIHTNPKVWRDPLRFDPDRWDTQETKDRHRCAYVLFATGPRDCIGFNFALLEVKALMSELVSRYEFVRVGLDAVDYDPEFQLIQPLNFYVRAKRRV